MRLAIPLYESRVAPRFCFAPTAWLVEVMDGEIATEESLALGKHDFKQRLERLAARGIDTILCGGFNREFIPYATQLGIRVVWGLYGDGQQMLAAFLQGDASSFSFAGSPYGEGRRARGRTRRRGKRPHTRHIEETAGDED